MTAKNSNFNFPNSFRAERFGRRALVGTVLSAAILMGITASAQTAPSSAPATASTSASTSSTANLRPDSAIAEDINTKLMASDTLRPLNLGIWVHDGTATLTGTVSSQDLRAQAEAMVKSVAGVKNVEDKITLGSAAAVAPGFSGQDGGAAGAVHPGDAQGPPPPPPADYDDDQSGSPSAPPPGYGANRNGPPAPPLYAMHQPGGMVTVAAVTPAYVMVMQPIDSKHTQIGTPFRGILVQDIVVEGGVIAVPRGTDVTGTVVDARGPGKLKGRPQIALQLTALTFASTTYPMTSQVWARGGPGKGGQSAANIGGSAAMGAIIGGAVGGGPTALLGGLLGGLGGAGISSLSSGPQLYVPPESVLTFYLAAPVTVHVPTPGDIHQLASHVPPSAHGRPAYGQGYPPQPVYYPPPPGGPPGGYPY